MGISGPRWLPRLLLILLTVLLIIQQYRLWFGAGSRQELVRLEQHIQQQELQNERLHLRNALLHEQVEELKRDLSAIEARARSELGFIREGERFYMVLESEPESSP